MLSIDNDNFVSNSDENDNTKLLQSVSKVSNKKYFDAVYEVLSFNNPNASKRDNSELAFAEWEPAA
jgi:hypothetical protein